MLVNHCWCSNSIWGRIYECDVIVTLNRVPNGKTYYDPPCPDWKLIEECEVNQDAPHHLFHDTLRPRADVIEWLNANINDCKNKKDSKGWAIGTDEYNSRSSISFSFFFQKQRDAMNFIKHWSVYKNPIEYCQYFKDIRKKLDLETGKLVSKK